VCVRLNVPQSLLLQVTVQSTPAAAVSFRANAVSAVLEAAVMLLGGITGKYTCIPLVAEVTVNVAVTVTEAVLAEVAVMVMVPPGGAAGGAVKTVAAPLAVWVGVKNPHAPARPHVTVQFTPPLLLSLLTVAVIPAVSFTPSVSGGVWLKLILRLEELEQEISPAAMKTASADISPDPRILMKDKLPCAYRVCSSKGCEKATPPPSGDRAQAQSYPKKLKLRRGMPVPLYANLNPLRHLQAAPVKALLLVCKNFPLDSRNTLSQQ